MFEEIREIKDLLNSEGSILRLLKRTDVELPEYDLYIECRCNKIASSTICKISAETLDLYLKGRLRTKELFLIRSDEQFYIRTGNDNTLNSFGDKFRTDYVEDLVYGNYYYTELPESCKANPDSREVMRFVKIFWQ